MSHCLHATTNNSSPQFLFFFIRLKVDSVRAEISIFIFIIILFQVTIVWRTLKHNENQVRLKFRLSIKGKPVIFTLFNFISIHLPLHLCFQLKGINKEDIKNTYPVIRRVKGGELMMTRYNKPKLDIRQAQEQVSAHTCLWLLCYTT